MRALHSKARIKLLAALTVDQLLLVEERILAHAATLECAFDLVDCFHYLAKVPMLLDDWHSQKANGCQEYILM